MPGSPFFKKLVLRCLGGILVFVFLFENRGAAIDHSTITEVVNDVSVLDPRNKNADAATTDEVFHVPDIMRTGADSRSEMVAEDQTITRVGANTLFSFEPKERVINLKEGSILFQSPRGEGGGTIRTASATASVLGTTIIVVATADGGFKLLVLEGTGQVRMPNGKRIVVHGGQLVVVPPGAAAPGPVVDFLLSQEVNTSLLVRGFKRPLPSWGKIEKQIQEQNQQIASGRFVVPGTVLGSIPNPNTRINQTQTQHLEEPTPAATPTPPPTPAPKPRRPRGSGFPIR